MTKEELWQAVLAQIQLNISSANFATWFQNTGILSKNKEEVIISVPNNFSKEWLENKYNKIILKILHSLGEEIKNIKYTISRAGLKTKSVPTTNRQPLVDETQLEFQQFKVNKETNLNPRYTFENFIVGPFNELAQAASCAVAKTPGAAYNPFFIYGGVGLGKTHLLQAIGNEITKNFVKKKIKYIPSEKFTSEIVSAIRNHSIENLKSTYRKIDVLVIDDIQFLAGKEKTQEEFFHIFNTLYGENKQIIISSDRTPKAIPGIEERLRSRFEGGMIADISIPDFETRMAILKTKCQEKKIDFGLDILEYIASNVQNNIRELEGALNRLIVHQKMKNQPLNLEATKNLLKKIIFTPKKAINPKKVIQMVSEFYDLKEKEIFASSRKKEIVKPRQIAMFILRQDLNYSFPFIGRKFLGKDHTTAIHAFNKISREIKINETLNEEINLIKQRIFLA